MTKAVQKVTRLPARYIEGWTVLDVTEELQLCRVQVAGAYHIELCDRMRAYELFGEIISQKMRMFVPTDASGLKVLAKVLDSYPVASISAREAA